MNDLPIWVTVTGLVVPLLTLSGSAAAFVVKLYLDAREKKRAQFFELMQFIDSDRPIATKIAAVYHLRQFPEHREFIVRFCEGQRNNIGGNGAHFLISEMDQTRDFMRK